jgi:hypothetical protein
MQWRASQICVQLQSFLASPGVRRHVGRYVGLQLTCGRYLPQSVTRLLTRKAVVAPRPGVVVPVIMELRPTTRRFSSFDEQGVCGKGGGEVGKTMEATKIARHTDVVFRGDAVWRTILCGRKVTARSLGTCLKVTLAQPRHFLALPLVAPCEC